MLDDARAALSRLRHPEGWVRASAPEERFGSLFGRDALITALQVLPDEPSIAAATLARLGAERGRTVDPETEEEPGKILHEARDHDLDAYVIHGWPVRDGRLRYWGSIDATPWYLIVAAALVRAGHRLDDEVVAAADDAAGWLARQDHPLAYRPANTKAGLAHQGWRDVPWDRQGSGHGVVDRDGRPMDPPVALAQVGALAWRALDEAATVLGRPVAGPAAAARAAWLDAFACDAAAPPAFAVHPGGTDPSPTSDLGQVLWTGILGPDDPRAHSALSRLLEPDLLTRFGFRTVAAEHTGFSHSGYHTGAVWPFDSWLGAGGLDAVEPGTGDRVRQGILEAVRCVGGFPELYAVEPEGALAPSDEACRVQAWTVGAVVAIGHGWDGRAWATG